MEFYYIALDVMREKPVFGLGFNPSLLRFIHADYEPKIYPKDGKHSFFAMARGINVFDNMFLSLVGEMSGPDVFVIASLLGQDKTLERLRNAISTLG